MHVGFDLILAGAALTFALVLMPLLLMTALYCLGQAARHHRALHASPHSIVTPLGYIATWDVSTQKLYAQGLARARDTKCYRPYVVKGEVRHG